MLQFLFSLSDTKLFLLLCLLFVVGSIGLLVIFKRFHIITFRYRDNAAIGNVAAMIGIIYGVLVGITALYLINNISFTADAVQREATAVANLYRDSNWLSHPSKMKIQDLVKKYLIEVINVEWPAMESGKPLSNNGGLIIDAIANEVNLYRIHNSKDMLVPHDMYEEVKTLYNAREQRIYMDNSQLNSELWVVILIGTILIIAINFFLRMSLALHIITMASASLMASSMIFLLVTLDSPFQGDFVIGPDALKSVLQYVEHK